MFRGLFYQALFLAINFILAARGLALEPKKYKLRFGMEVLAENFLSQAEAPGGDKSDIRSLMQPSRC
jgi:hypothetical protein